MASHSAGQETIHKWILNLDALLKSSLERLQAHYQLPEDHADDKDADGHPPRSAHENAGCHQQRQQAKHHNRKQEEGPQRQSVAGLAGAVHIGGIATKAIGTGAPGAPNITLSRLTGWTSRGVAAREHRIVTEAPDVRMLHPITRQLIRGKKVARTIHALGAGQALRLVPQIPSGDVHGRGGGGDTS